jgi:hemerythrin superfamily protein
MLERLLLPSDHAISLLLEDHDRVKKLFDRFEKAKSAKDKERIIASAVNELKIHAAIEEEIFYPTVRQHVGQDMMNEADEEHHVARLLIAELDRGTRADDHRDAKFTVLAENVRHHIKEEEGEMLPKAKELDIDFISLGNRMLTRKAKLQREGVPSDAEHAVMSSVRGSADTPAANARRRSAADRRPMRKRSTSRAKRSSSRRRPNR